MKKRILILTDRPEHARESHYMQDLLAVIRAQPRRPGKVSYATVYHEAGCSLLTESGACDCEPEIEVREVQG